MLTSIEVRILNNKLNLLKKEINHLTICSFLEQSIKDILFYYQNFDSNIFYKISKDKEIFKIFYSLKNNKNALTINFEKFKAILKFFKIIYNNNFSEQELEKVEDIFKKRNIFAHENIENENQKDFFVIFKVINLLLIETNKILFITKQIK